VSSRKTRRRCPDMPAMVAQPVTGQVAISVGSLQNPNDPFSRKAQGNVVTLRSAGFELRQARLDRLDCVRAHLP